MVRRVTIRLDEQDQSRLNKLMLDNGINMTSAIKLSLAKSVGAKMCMISADDLRKVLKELNIKDE